jgi:peptidoglycan/LPS O-acetylase OafA/YrhL
VVFRGRPRALAIISLIVCAACLVIRTVFLLVHPELIGTLATYRRSEMRFDAIAVGVLLAALAEMHSGRALIARLGTPRIFYASLLILALSFVIRNEFFKATIRFTIQSFILLPIFCNILFSPSLKPVKTALNLGPMEWIGKLSYSIYIWHGGVEYFGGWLVHALPLAVQPESRVVLTMAAASASYYFVERPFLDLRRRIEPLFSGPPAIAHKPG